MVDNKLNFSFQLSLKQNAIRRVTVNLWNSSDVFYSIEKFPRDPLNSYGYYSNTWQNTVESQVRRNLLKLKLPTRLYKEILLFLTPIGLEIKAWKEFHEQDLILIGEEKIFKKHFMDSYVKFDALILSKLVWTTTGTVDYQKTAEELIRCKLLDAVKRYKLACCYCLEDYILILFEELPEEFKSIFYNENFFWHIHWSSLEYCWPFILKGELPKLDSIVQKLNESTEISFNEHSLLNSIKKGNRFAVEYFLKQLSDERKKHILCTFHAENVYRRFNGIILFEKFPIESYTLVSTYLLSIMNYEQQIGFFERQSATFLCRLLNWHHQDIFVRVVDVIWSLVPEQDYLILLQTMFDHFIETNYYFPPSFRELFKHSPKNFKKLFVDRECRLGIFFPFIFRHHDTETIEVIMKNVDLDDRFRLVSCESMFKLFYSVILTSSCQLLKLCLREATLSNELMDAVRIGFLQFLSSYGNRNSSSERSQKFIQLIDEIQRNPKKKYLTDNA